MIEIPTSLAIETNDTNVSGVYNGLTVVQWIMTAPALPPGISELVARILRENERAFCIISDEYQGGGHPLPIYCVDENGRGVECGHADVVIVDDGTVIAAFLRRTGEDLLNVLNGRYRGCIYYECVDVLNRMDRGPYVLLNHQSVLHHW